MRNLNLLFNKSLYSKIGQTDQIAHAEKISRSIVGTVFNDADYETCKIPDVRTILMQVGYPGLTMGLGYAHFKVSDAAREGNEGKNTSFQADNGFSFDYVTGQPYLPGSSVKGVLRSMFEHEEIIREILGLGDDFDVKALEADIFSAGDVFLDAVVRRSAHNGRVIAIDNITPHKDALVSPDIHSILRVVPGVMMEFRFLLRDSDGCTADDKLKLFTTILSDFGIGAKTNVGYGILTPVTVDELNGGPAPRQQMTASSDRGGVQTRDNAAPHMQPEPEKPAPAPTISIDEKPQAGAEVSARVTAIRDREAVVELIRHKGYTGTIGIKNISKKKIAKVSECLKKGQIVRAKVIGVRFIGGQVNVELSMIGVAQTE